MDERAALALVADHVGAAGDDCAVLEDIVLTTDMLHESTDFPAGTTRYTAGWRAVGASLSDVGAMGADASGAVAVYGAPVFHGDELERFLRGCIDVCEAVGAEYVGGDLDGHDEFTVATTAIGRTDDPVFRSGASPGDAVCVTGTFGRSAAALRLFESGEVERANELFLFQPRVAAGRAIAPYSTSMIDSSDGLARSLHQLAAASDCGFEVAYEAIPIDPAVEDVVVEDNELREMGLHFGEDFELVFTVAQEDVADVVESCASLDEPVDATRIGEVTTEGVSMDDEALPDRGYTH